MGRPRKPDEIKILDGTFRADRDGDPSKQIVADGEPVPPVHLKGEALAFWSEVVPGLVASGVAKARDAGELATMCEWWARHRRFSRMLDRMPNTHKKLFQTVTMAAIATDKFDKIASRFGLTPSDRAKLRIPEKENKGVGVMKRKRG